MLKFHGNTFVAFIHQQAEYIVAQPVYFKSKWPIVIRQRKTRNIFHTQSKRKI